MHPIHAVEVVSNISTLFGILPFVDMHGKFYGDCPTRTPPLGGGGLYARVIAKYSDFRPIKGYISETVQDRRQVSINH